MDEHSEGQAQRLANIGTRLADESASRPAHGTLVAESDVRFELRCAACGYGVIVRIAPERCPMCRGSVWEHTSEAPRGGVPSNG